VSKAGNVLVVALPGKFVSAVSVFAKEKLFLIFGPVADTWDQETSLYATGFACLLSTIDRTFRGGEAVKKRFLPTFAPRFYS
jgi:hypothetical protein